MYVPFKKWVPEGDPVEEGNLTDVNGMIPTYRGFMTAPGAVKEETSALSATCRGFSSEVALDGTKAVFAGTESKLYRKVGATWSDVTRASGNYTLVAEAGWCFTTQGNVTFAVSEYNRPQKYIHGTNTVFGDVTAMPMCAVAETLGRHVLIGNISALPDQWACSAIDDYTNWTASVDNQCVYGRLVDTSGEITAIKRLSDYVVYYKSASMYLCRYVGVPDVFAFSLVSDNVGAVSQSAVVRIGRVHYFCGETNFYSFDSATLTPIGEDIRLWFNENCNNTARNQIVATKDESRQIIYWFYPSISATTPDKFVAYHYTTGRWGKGDLVVYAANEYYAVAPIYSALASLYTTYAAYSTYTYAELKFAEDSYVPAVIGTDLKLKLLTGASTGGDLTTTDFGLDGQMTLIRRVRPRFVDGYTAYPDDLMLMDNYYREHMGDEKTFDKTSVLEDGKFDVLRSSRWHSGKITVYATAELSGIDVEAKPSGKE